MPLKRFKLLSLLLLALAWPMTAYSQGAFISGTANSVVNGLMRPLAGATVTVCAASTSGTPCSPALANALFRDSALTQTLANPTTTDSQGNYNFAMASGQYTLTITASGFTGSTQQVTVSCGGGSCTASSLNVTNLVVSGTGTAGLWNGVCIVDGVKNATLAAAVTCAGTSGVIEIPMFAVPALTGNVTTPVGVTLRFDGPSGITTTGFTLTINGPIVAPPVQLFFGTGTVSIPNMRDFWAAWFPGADICTSALAAYNAGPVGLMIHFLPGSFNCTTPLNFATASKWFTLIGAPAGTTLNFTPTSGTALTVNAGTGVGLNHFRGWGVRDIILSGPGSGTGTGVLLGGTNGAEGFTWSGGEIIGFQTLISYTGMNAWKTVFSNVTVKCGGCTTLLSVPSGANEEGTVYDMVTFINDGGAFISSGINMAAASTDITFRECSFDDVQLTMSTGVVHVNNPHFENPGPVAFSSQYILNTGGTLYLEGGDYLQDATGATLPTEYVRTSGAGVTVASALNFFTAATTTIPAAFTATGNGPTLFVFGTRNLSNGGGTITSEISTSGATGNVRVLSMGCLAGAACFPANNNENLSAAQLQLGGTTGVNATLTHSNASPQTYTLPNQSGNVVLDTATQTLTNKTLTSPVISSSLPNTTFGVARTNVAGSTTLLAANSCGDTVTVTVTGAATTMDAHASGAISTGLIERAWVSAANTVSVQYCNVTTAGITPAAATIQVTVFQ